MTVAWYVHHHGAGHRARLAATLPRLRDAVVVLSSLAPPAGLGVEWVQLPLDFAARPRDPDAGGTLHWAPLGHAGLRDRMATVAATLSRLRADVLVADVSVEVALLARLLGVPTVVVAQRGRRTDAPHRLAYAQAGCVALPWTAATDLRGSGPTSGRHAFVGAVSRFDDDAPFAPVEPGGDVLLVVGAGGHGLAEDAVRAAALTTPARTWHVAGALRAEGDNVVDHGPRADVEALLRRCSVVVGSGGGNVVAEVAAARRPFVCLPQDRPFEEQRHTGRALRRLGVAEVRDTFPPAREWPALLAAAEARDVDRWGALHDGQGGRRLAAVVAAVRDGAPVGEAPAVLPVAATPAAAVRASVPAAAVPAASLPAPAVPAAAVPAASLPAPAVPAAAAPAGADPATEAAA